MRAPARFSISSKLMSSSVTASSLNTTRGDERQLQAALALGTHGIGHVAAAQKSRHVHVAAEELVLHEQRDQQPLERARIDERARKWRVAQPAT